VKISSPEYHRTRLAIQPGNGGSPRRLAEQPLFEAKASIQRGCDIDHVYALEELMPRWGSAESHSSGRVFPHGNYDTRDFGRSRAALKRLLYSRLLGRRPLTERSIDWNDYHVLTVAPELRHLKGGHRARLLRSGFCHVSYMFSPARKLGNVDSVSSTVSFLSLSGLTASKRK